MRVPWSKMNPTTSSSESLHCGLLDKRTPYVHRGRAKGHALSQAGGSETKGEQRTCLSASRNLRLLTDVSEHPEVEPGQLRSNGVALRIAGTDLPRYVATPAALVPVMERNGEDRI